MNTTDFLSIASAICPDRNAMIFEGKRYTYTMFSERVNKMSNVLRNLGVEKGDRVAMFQVNCPECLETYFATAKLGVIYVPLNFRAKSNELEYMLEHSEAKVLLLGNRYVDMVKELKPSLTKTKHFIALDEKTDEMPFYGDLISAASADEIFEDIADDDVTILMYTSGTTGRPKGVPLRHNGFISYVLENVEPANPDIEETNILTVPLYHVAGIQAMMAAIYGGRTLALMRQFETKEWMDTVQNEKANRAMLVPTMLKYIVDYADFDKYDLSSMKVITYGAAPMPFEVINKAMKMLPKVKFINAFGQTETASTITSLGPDDHVIEGTEEEKEKKLKRLTSSIGKPLPDVQVKILGENGKELPRGETGDIVAKGSRIMTGYWNDEQKTEQAFTKDGWLITGDRGWQDEDGYIYLAGRGDDLIIRGGENISPDELANVIDSYPKVEESAVIAVPDDEFGQVPRAIVVLKEGQEATADEIKKHCRSKLASFKCPASYVFIDKLPRNQMGKILMKDLRAKYGQP
jgi:acyl-CoA synthetase (AMP-forming)/AMP-acid ligase II